MSRETFLVAMLILTAPAATADQSPARKSLEDTLRKMPESVRSAIEDLIEEKFGKEQLVFAADVPVDFGAADETNEKAFGWKLRRGQEFYQEKCLRCHGAFGDGNGIDANGLTPAPRDLQKMGVIRWQEVRHTEKPSSHDISETIRLGLPGTEMKPADLPPEDRLLVAEYVRWLAIRGEVRERSIRELSALTNDDKLHLSKIEQDIDDIYRRVCKTWSEQPTAVINIPADRPSSPESVARGRKLYISEYCVKCHGDSGHGDGEVTKKLLRNPFTIKPYSRPGLHDNSDWPITPRDLAAEPFKGGNSRRDVYGRIVHGIGGSQMPFFDVKPEEAWDLVDYVESLRSEPFLKTLRAPKPDTSR